MFRISIRISDLQLKTDFLFTHALSPTPCTGSGALRPAGRLFAFYQMPEAFAVKNRLHGFMNETFDFHDFNPFAGQDLTGIGPDTADQKQTAVADAIGQFFPSAADRRRSPASGATLSAIRFRSFGRISAADPPLPDADSPIRLPGWPPPQKTGKRLSVRGCGSGMLSQVFSAWSAVPAACLLPEAPRHPRGSGCSGASGECIFRPLSGYARSSLLTAPEYFQRLSPDSGNRERS